MELAEEVSARAGDVVDGDGELAVATDVFDGDAFRALGDGALVLGQGTGSSGRGSGLGRGAAGGGQGDLDAPVDGAGLVAVSLTLGSDSPLPDTDVCHLSSLVSCARRVLTALARFSDRVWL